MSVPSTITATLPPPHNHHYGYSNHQTYQNSGGLYGTNSSLLTGSSRLAPSYSSFASNTPATVTRNSTNSSSSRQPPSSSTMTASQSTSTLQMSKKRERRPDWHEFYKNGPPKEIIVIDDDSPPPQKRNGNDNERANHTTRTLMRGDTTEHTNKKRRTGHAPVLEPIKFQQPSYSHARSDGDTASNTISTDRTASLQTTAPTSLGSHTSHGSSGTYLEDAVVGQKRKRVTRQQTAEEKQRKEIEVVGDAYSSYVPPPKPPIKAKDVHVPPVKDVRAKMLGIGSVC